MIYLDNAATSFPKPESVYVAMDRFARTSLANPGRAGHRMALQAEHALNNARHRLNRFFDGRNPERFIFTLNCTDAINLAIKGLLNDGDHVITSNLEHNSVSRPLVSLAEAGRITLTRIAADAGGVLNPADIEAAITPKTRLIAITHASNVLGTIQPIAEIGKICQKHAHVVFLVDAAQTAGVVPISVTNMHIDLLALPGHKSLLGPTGTGVLYVSPRVELRPWREGGTGGDSTTPTQPRDYPYYLEGGTPNVLGVVGMVAGLDYVEERGLETIRSHEVMLCQKLRDALEPSGAYEFYGHADYSRRVGTISLRHQSLTSTIVGTILDESFQIAIRPGLHCAPYVHLACGTSPDGMIRVSPGVMSTEADIDVLIQALKDAAEGM